MPNLSLIAKSNWIKNRAKELGFDLCGITSPHGFSEEEKRFKRWIDNGYHGKMEYLANNFEKRMNPALLVENTKSIIVVGLNYYPEQKQLDSNAPRIAKYAYGNDYHLVLKPLLQQLLEDMNNHFGSVSGRAFTDSAPILEHALAKRAGLGWEHALAKRAGLGWVGKNSLLINKKIGSFFFIGELFVDMELEYDSPDDKSYCGNCSRCMDACPTGAITEPHVVNGSKCISYFTIELKGDIPADMQGKFKNQVFGCDICQDVCPWNKKAKPHKINALKANSKLLELTKTEWENLNVHQYGEIFKGSAVKRTKWKGLQRNLNFLEIRKTEDDFN